MRHERLKVLFLALVIIGCVVGFAFVGATDDSIQLTAREFIRAGDDWQVTVRIDAASAGETATATLVNGLQFLDEELVLGTGGVAVWQIPAETITQAGTSQLVVSYQDVTVRKSLRVLPKSTESIELFSGSNNLTAYGDSSTTLMILPNDAWGNTPASSDRFDLDITYPDTTRATGEFEMLGGIGLYQLTSQGVPGRLRLQVSANEITTTLELSQIPSQARRITLALDADCVLSDGRDIITMSMDVTDKRGKAVVDGTLITIKWDDGLGYARTIDGRATLRLPTFQQTGEVTFTAQVGDVSSRGANLRIVEDTCLE